MTGLTPSRGQLFKKFPLAGEQTQNLMVVVFFIFLFFSIFTTYFIRGKNCKIMFDLATLIFGNYVLSQC
jgi:hypothetical protein